MSRTSIAKIPTQAETAAIVATAKQDAMLLGLLTLCVETPDRVQGRVPVAVRDVLPAVLDDARARVRAADTPSMTNAMTKILAQIGGPMGQEDRLAWQVAAAEMFLELPGDLVIDGLHDARRVCTRVPQVIAHVFDYARKPAQRRRERLQALEKLAELAELPAITG